MEKKETETGEQCTVGLEKAGESGMLLRALFVDGPA